MVKLLIKYKTYVIFSIFFIVICVFYFGFYTHPVSAPSVPSVPGPTKDCKLAGCSSELCLDKNAKDVATICLYKNEYAATKMRNVKLNQTGSAGGQWTVLLLNVLRNLEKRIRDPNL
jgi:eight-cysteine-cluster-containing protein